MPDPTEPDPRPDNEWPLVYDEFGNFYGPDIPFPDGSLPSEHLADLQRKFGRPVSTPRPATSKLPRTTWIQREPTPDDPTEDQ